MKYNIKHTIFDFIKQNRTIIGVYLLLSLAFPLAEVVLPKYYGEVIDNISQAKTGDNLFLSSKSMIITILSLWGILMVLYMSMDSLDSKIIPQLQSFVRKNIILDIIDTFKDNYQELEIGDLLAKIIKLPIIIRDLAHQFRNFILPAILIVIGIMIYFTYLAPMLGIVFIINMVIIVWSMFSFGKSCIHNSKNMNDQHNKLHEDISDLFNNLINVYSANSVQHEVELLEKRQDIVGQEYRKTIDCSARFKLLFNLMNFISFTTINGTSFYLYSKGVLKLPHVVSILIVSLFLVSNLNNLGGEIRDFVFNMGTAMNMQSYLDDLNSSTSTHKMKESHEIKHGNIRMKNVNLKFADSGHSIFNNLNINIPARQKVAIVGKNGSGKTTFIKMLMKLKSYDGDIYIDGKNIKYIDPNQLRNQIIYVPQHPKLFNRSIYDNITYGIKGVSKKQVSDMIHRFGLSKVFGEQLNLDKSVGKNGVKLSGGQIQIVFLLRCLLRNVPIIVMDEPTSALDSGNKDHVFNILHEIMKDKTVIMITHDKFLLQYADRIVTIGNGTILNDQNK
jgi:ATP-binding cassette subfamily B protein